MYFLNKMISTIISLSVFFFLGTCDNTSMSKKQIYKYVSENKFELDKTLNEYALENEDGNINISDLNIPYSKGIQNANVVFYTGKSTEKPFFDIIISLLVFYARSHHRLLLYLLHIFRLQNPWYQ